MKKLPREHRIIMRCLLLACFVFSVGLSGCNRQSEFDIAEATTRQRDDTRLEKSADFRTAMGYLDNLHEFEMSAATTKICYHLHRWASDQKPDPDWIADPLYSQLPNRLNRMKSILTPLAEKATFSAFDVMMLREAIWMRDLARQMKAAEIQDSAFAGWLESAGLDDRVSEDLRIGFSICDWVVRNVELDPIHSKAGHPVESPDTEDSGSPEGDSEGPMFRDGADSLPWESLLIGHGDWVSRSRIATLMGRQLGMNIIMLGIEGDGEDRPWCLGIQLGEQLYLFDMRLGLPVPAEGDQGIATLEQVIETPELVRALDDPDGEAYPVSNADLGNVIGLIDAAPEYLTQRMKIIEASLTNKSKMVLTCSPSAIKQELNKCKGIVNVRLWTVPYDAYWQRMKMQSKRRTAKYMVRLLRDLQLIDGNLGHPLAAGRRQHFRGIFASTDDVIGAKEFYLNSRQSESDISKFDARAGLDKERQKEIEASKLAALNELGKTELRKYKRYASYWLGLIAFDEGNLKMATNYFDKRLLSVAEQDTIWSQGGRYNLARTLEQMASDSTGDEAKGLKERARSLYVEDAESPQYAGNRIRAKRLE